MNKYVNIKLLKYLSRIFQRGGRLSISTGIHGVLEEYASARAVGMLGQEAVNNGKTTSLRNIQESITAKHVFDCSKLEQGDKVSNEFVSETIDILAVTAVNMVRIFDTKHIIFGGGLISAGDSLLHGIRERFKHHYWKLTSF